MPVELAGLGQLRAARQPAGAWSARARPVVVHRSSTPGMARLVDASSPAATVIRIGASSPRTSAGGESSFSIRPWSMIADPVAEHLRLVHVVRGEHHRATGLVQPGQQVPQVAPGLRVERCGRLVEEDDLGVVHQRAGDREPLASARRTAPRPGCRPCPPGPRARATRRPGAAETPYSEAKVGICSRAVSRSKNDDACSCTPIRGSSAGLRGQGVSPSTVTSPRPAGGVPRSSPGWWSCRHRWARGCRRTLRSATSKLTPSTASRSP